MLVSRLEHIADEWKNVNMLLQIQINFITYMTCVQADGPAHLSIIRVYIVCIDPADAQADLGVPYPHVIRSFSIWIAPNHYWVSLEAIEHIYVHVHYMYIDCVGV